MAGETIEVVIKVKDDASAGLKGIRAQTAGLSDDLLDVDSSAEDAAGGFDLMAVASSPAAAGVLAIGTAAVTAAAGVFKLAQGASDWVDKIGKAANETQLNTKTVVALESALGAAGLELNEGSEALKGLGAQLKAAIIDGGKAEEKFTDLGIAIRDEVTGETLSMDEVFRDTIDTLRLIPNEADRNAAAMNLFGESGTRLIPIIEGGTVALDEWGRSAEAAGKVINEETLQASADFDEAMVNINNTIEGLVVTVGTDLIPIISDAADVFVAIAGPLATVWDWMRRIAAATNIVGIAFDAISGDAGALGERLDFVTGGTSAQGAAGQSQAESDRISAGVEAGFLGVDGLTDAQRAEQAAKEAADRDERRAEFRKQAEKEIADRGKAVAKVVEQIDEFAGQNLFNKLVDEQALAGLVEADRLQAEAATEAAASLDAFNLAAKEAEQATLDRAKVDREAAVDAARLAKEEQIAGVKALLEQVDEQIAAEPLDLEVEAPRTGAQKAEGVAGALSAVQGGLTGILGALGPAGAVASGIVGVASNLPEIIDGIIDSIDDILVGLVEGLPKIFFELIPALVKAMLKDIPQAIADALFGVLEQAFPGFKGAKQRAGQALDRSPEALRFFVASQTGGLAGGTKQNFASGGFVNRSGMAMVHEGERFLARDGVSSSGDNARSRLNGGGQQVSAGGVTVIINVTGLLDPQGIDRLVEEINRAVGSRGLNVASVR